MPLHSFSVEIAMNVGVNAAIILQNISYWCEKNMHNETHFHDGNYWTYNSVRAFSDMFPYMTAKQIRSAIHTLVDNSYLVEGEYNETKYDRTKWYAVTEVVKSTLGWGNSTCPTGQIKLPHRANQIAPQGKPIPDIKPDSKPDENNTMLIGVTASSPSRENCPHEKIIALYHETLPELPKVKVWNEKRKKWLASRWREEKTRQDMDYWRKLFDYVSRSDFLMGRANAHGREPFKCDLEWIVNASNFVKIIEGKYHRGS